MKKIRNLVLAGLLGVVGVFGVYSFDSKADTQQARCIGDFADGQTGEIIPCH
ncbi:hypothetical protein [Bacillus tropicus]|uniref:hypothetical protein n=1 Tax=Bacillus tropicus TaxID=2026188 RepID=UPI000A9D7D1D|nr:hypothetical protein [Bacillus tropicus]